ncbi:MAG: hypothetical protein IJF74_04940 [Clostridia bacterium]|nr:hypothetical protein [Clostridia bacterium]
MADNELPKRKTARLRGFDYSTSGAYFVTVCVQDRKSILSEITAKNDDNEVGEGLAPPATRNQSFVDANVVLKPCGEIAEEQLFALEKRYDGLKISDYVIMPEHIHAIIIISERAGGASPSPTLNDVICTFKSLTAKQCKAVCGVEKIFQRSYFDHIIRDNDDYRKHRNYIVDNPRKRLLEEKLSKDE